MSESPNKRKLTMTCPYCQSHVKKFGKFGPKKIQRYRCRVCGKTFSAEERVEGMYTDLEKAVQVINLLAEGCGINAAARIAHVNKRTVLRLLLLAGERCEKLMDSRLRNISVRDIQCDEIWTFVEKKEKHVKLTDNRDLIGDQYTYVAMDPTTKLVITFAVGKRNIPTTEHFIADLSDRISSYVQINTDSFGAYINAIRRAFGWDANHGVIRKIYAGNVEGGSGRYSPPAVIGAIRMAASGTPIEANICTSHVERNNLNMRTFLRRMTRLCLGFSKKLENLKAAVALYFAWSNFVRIHTTIKTTPAVASGLTDHVWTLEELLRSA